MASSYSVRGLALGALAALAAQACALGADLPKAPATAQSLCDALIASMKRGSALDFSGRKRLLQPTVAADFDLPTMTRVVVGGPTWRGLSEQDRQDLIEAFSEVSVASYASEFKAYGGEKFEVDPAPAAMPNGYCVVHTRLIAGSTTVELDYVERPIGEDWKIIDVLLNGSISQLAARRSEYSATLRTGGAPALVRLLRTKAGDMAQ